MKQRTRAILDKLFTVVAGGSVVLLSLILLAVLGPMIYNGAGAVVFKGTVEFRKMQLGLFNVGDANAVKAESAEVEKVRDKVYASISDFREGLDTQALSDHVRDIHREFGHELRDKGVATDEYSRLRDITRQIRDTLEDAFASTDVNDIRKDVASVMKYKDEPAFKGTLAADFFKIADKFEKTAETTDLSKLSEYSDSLKQVEDILTQLFGPKPGEPLPPSERLRYGATRWDKSCQLLDQLLYVEKWVETEPGQPLQKTKVRRAQEFAGTDLADMFTFVEKSLPAMMHPRLTFYWRFFTQDNFNSHYFGGVGPEIIGTLLITVLGMAFAVPLGLISAAYLVECSSDNIIVRIIRMCINTLAGVPSIVFGLFGLAFFVLYLFPRLHLGHDPCILAGSLTLAVLTLPVMIRASEEAIRSVPRTYKEASLALGAGAFRTFVTVTMPAALPGILTGIILSLSRIAGETAPILFTAAAAFTSRPVPKSLLDQTRTLSYGSYDMAVNDRIASMVPHNQYGMVVTLIALILLLNGAAIVLRSRVFKKLKGQ